MILLGLTSGFKKYTCYFVARNNGAWLNFLGEFSKFMMEWNFLFVNSISIYGGLVIGWRKISMRLTNSMFVESSIGEKITSPYLGEIFFVTKIYGP
jgi:hypothetical protein